MNVRLLGALGAGILLLVALVITYRLRDTDDGPATATPVAETVEITDFDEDELEPAGLYFPDERGTLTREERLVRPAVSPETRARALIEGVLAGPTDSSLGTPFAETVGLGITYLSPTAILYVDLESEHERPPLTGSLEELLAVYSLVNTVLLDSDEIEAVVLLWNGQQPKTFAGHLDTSIPLGPDRDLIAFEE